MRQPVKFILPDSQPRTSMRSRSGPISKVDRGPVVATRPRLCENGFLDASPASVGVILAPIFDPQWSQITRRRLLTP